ncbi:MAG TPA: alpha-glucosidase/alpha-galactosidase, partial [Armatimonadota bacterium]|nr:alpha-glucosidase/alpha-galactosidase [Armatimonadota bacterium]
MIKVAMIGAGSVVFSKNLTGDILSYPEFREATFSYMDIDPERLEVGAALCEKVGRALGAQPKIEATQDRRKALEGADFVINMVQIGGFDSTLVDFEIPRKYGLNFTIADTTGPGGFFRALRTYPMLSGLVRDMEDVCPRAVLLNYSNPMDMNMQTVFHTGSIRAVGLCHSVQGTFNQIMRDIGEKPEDVAFICAGINHMAFYLKLEKDGEDLYPRLFAAADEPRIFGTNKVRYELMKRLGYFITESSEHNAEYCPYFIPHGRDMIDRFDVPIDEYLRRCDGIVGEFERMKRFSKSDAPMEVHKSHEYGSIIIHSLVTGQPSVVYGNVRNGNSISNLPASAIVEVPTLVDRAGLQPTVVGELPPQLVGYMQPHVTQRELFIRAATEGRRDHVYQAAMFDPLTAATLTLDQIVEMCDELIAAHGDLLPPLDAKSRVTGSGKSFSAVDPKDLRASWDTAQKEAASEFLREWRVAGPFRTATPAEATLEVWSPVEEALAQPGDGALDLSATYAAGDGQVEWRELETNPQGYLSLNRTLGPADGAVAYAYAEVESVHPRETVLRTGSAGGIKIWLNGQPVHCHEAQRNHIVGADEVPV